MTNEEKAFLDMIAFGEGTLGVSYNGYDALFNDNKVRGKSRIIAGWTENTTMKHGDKNWLIRLDPKTVTTAGGRYQFLGSTWIELNNMVNVAFTKSNQDITAIKYVKKNLGNDFDFKINDITKMISIAKSLGSVWDSFNKKSAKDLFGIYTDALNLYKFKK